MSKENKMESFRFKDTVAFMESQRVLRVEDVKGREYMWDGIELYRLISLKGRRGRLPKSN